MNATSNTVLHFDIELGNNVGFKSLVFLKILFGRGVNDVSDVEALDGLILGAESAAVYADDRLNITSVIFVSTVVSSFDWHVV